MKNLLYFEEYVSELSKKLYTRKDINLIILRAKKTLDKYFDSKELNTNYPCFIFDTEKDFDLEMNRFINWLKANKIKIDYFLNDSEYYLEFANKVARQLNLESLSENQVNWVRDKVYMKEKFEKIGLRTVKYSPVESKQDVINFFYKNGQNSIIFKPRRLMNSINVYKIESIDDINNLNIIFKKDKYMVETYCPYQEWSIESLVQNGIVIDSYVTYIPNRTLWAAINNQLNCHMTVPVIPDYFKFVPKDLIQKIVDGMELKNGAMTIEVFIDDNGNVIPSELGWRLPGCQATSNHGKSYGFDMYNALIDIAIKKPVNLTYNEKIISVGDLYLPNKEGTISDVTSLDDLLKMDGVIDGRLFVKKGDIQRKRRVGNDASGWVQVKGIDEFDTLNKMQNIFDSFIIKTKEEVEVKRYVKKI